jgi:GTP-binding protein HflX
LLVWNKIDLAALEPSSEMGEYDKIERVFLSARTGAGIDLLRDAIAKHAQLEALKRVSAPLETENDDIRFN